MRQRFSSPGFSLLEMLVAVGLFASVVIVAIGSVMVLLKGQKKAFFIQTNQYNVRFAIEAIAREIRTGINYTQGNVINIQPLVYYDNPITPATCLNMQYLPGQPRACIQFVNAQGELVFIKQSTNLTECGAPPSVTTVSCIAKSSTPIPLSPLAMVPFQPMTAPEVSIQSLSFVIAGEAKGALDYYQPRVTIIIRAVTPGTDTLQTRLDAQTTVSQLKLDP